MPKSDTKSTTRWYRDTRTKAAGVIAAALLTVGAFEAAANPTSLAHIKTFASDTGGWFGGLGWRKRGFSNLSDAELEAKIEKFVKHAVIELDASEEQRLKITPIAVDAAKQFRAARKDWQAARKQFRRLLLDDEIDRAALEKVRTERLSEADRMSKVVVDTMTEISTILTPEQRIIVNERMDRFQEKRRRWHRD